MRDYPVPDNEQVRLRVLHGLGIAISAPINEVQRLAEVASWVAGTPIALVSLVDADVQIFAANVGLPGVNGTSRDVSFCAHAIMGREQLVVADAREDVRFQDNPLVTAGPGIRAYAGSVLELDDGAHVGTLCVIDTKPRKFSADVLAQLDHLSRAISGLLRAHRDHLDLFERIKEEARGKEDLRARAEEDPLTGLLNQASFRTRVDTVLKAANGDVSLAVIDVDYFKQVNDRWGHPFGDRYLKLIAGALVTHLGPDAVVGRIGGDEFAALLPKGGPQTHLDAIDNTRRALREAVVDIGKPNLGKLSVGLCPAAAADQQNFETLYQRADVALYASKDRGRNITSIFNEALDGRYNLRVLRSRFSEGLEDGDVEAFFQPKVTLVDGRVFGFELLARWRDHRRGLLTPASFEKLLLDPIVAPELTRRMIGAAIDAQSDLHRRGIFDIRLAVNVTHFDLSNPMFVEEVTWSLQEAGLNWSCLELEVTERAILADTDLEMRQSLNDVRDKGARIAMDDFGTGHGGLSHLRDWPIDVLKLDKSFVSNVSTNERDATIVQSIVSLAQNLGMQVTAEGIETREVAAKLIGMGCGEGQGFLYAPPLPWTDALLLLRPAAA